MVVIRCTRKLLRHLENDDAIDNHFVGAGDASSAGFEAQAFGTTPQFWINLQSNYDLAKAQPAHSVAKIRRAS